MAHSAARHFAVMGTQAHVVVVQSSPTRATKLLGLAEQLIRELELRWSRFDANSEVSRLNRSEGEKIRVSPETFELLTKSVLAHALTNGRFNPTLLPSLEALGYDRTFADVQDRLAPTQPALRFGGGVADIELDEEHQTVRMHRGVRFDPGGIGKGLAADMIGTKIIDAGALGVLINLGGDVRVMGESPANQGAWVISIREPAYQEAPLATVALTDSALATSTTLRRRWLRNDTLVHHVLDPATLSPTDGPSLVSTIATSGWWAEASATALLVNAEPSIEGIPRLTVDRSGPHRSGDFAQFELEMS